MCNSSGLLPVRKPHGVGDMYSYASHIKQALIISACYTIKIQDHEVGFACNLKLPIKITIKS